MCVCVCVLPQTTRFHYSNELLMDKTGCDFVVKMYH